MQHGYIQLDIPRAERTAPPCREGCGGHRIGNGSARLGEGGGMMNEWRIISAILLVICVAMLWVEIETRGAK